MQSRASGHTLHASPGFRGVPCSNPGLQGGTVQSRASGHTLHAAPGFSGVPCRDPRLQGGRVATRNLAQTEGARVGLPVSYLPCLMPHKTNGCKSWLARCRPQNTHVSNENHAMDVSVPRPWPSAMQFVTPNALQSCSPWGLTAASGSQHESPIAPLQCHRQSLPYILELPRPLAWF